MTKARPLAAAIRRNEWERAALLLLIGLLEAARGVPPDTIDDVLAMLSDEGIKEPQISQMDGEPQRLQRTRRKRPAGGTR